ncbi:acyl-CoA carboxylase epsilon subunit [Oryzobacter telluris]|jgi:hypothetical protein|uniref:acyl-CoA carboxylase epsilon subunit n=1 Tax=Oryzobacter telluris TaxID=3149179 RepID=UPI00370D967D
MSDATSPAQTPEIRVLGDATPEEVAAVVAVLTAASAGGDGSDGQRPGSSWASRAAVLRTPVPHGPGAWRTTLRP